MNTSPSSPETGFNFAYLDEQTKRSIRRALLKAVAIPGHQIPFSSREMPMSYETVLRLGYWWNPGYGCCNWSN